MDCFTNIQTSGGTMSKTEHWTPMVKPFAPDYGFSKDLQSQFTNQFQSFWPTPDLDAHQGIETLPSSGSQSSGYFQQKYVCSPPALMTHQQPIWSLQTHSNVRQSASLLNNSSTAWSAITSQESAHNTMIGDGTMLQNFPNTQVTPMIQDHVIPQSSQIRSQNRSNGIVKNKRKRKRTAFTTDQILALEKIFSTQPYIDRTERQSIADRLKINERAVKIWFQNRRMKSKRDSLEDSDEQEEDVRGEIFISQNSPPSEFDYIETQIQRTDQFGYVTLDENVLGTLVHVLDEILPSDVVLTAENILEPVESDKVKSHVESTDFFSMHESTQLKSPRDFQSDKLENVVYEPISPAESCPNDDCDWEPPQDQESLKKLFNLHFC